MKWLFVRLILIFYSVSCLCNETQPKYYFDRLTTENGLSGNIVRAIYKDYKGFMWFGLENALNRYDGYNYKIFRHNPLDSNSLSGGAVAHVIEDTLHNLWVATKDGACIFNRNTESFTSYFNAVEIGAFNRCFYSSKKYGFLLVTTKGIFRFNYSIKKFVKLFKGNFDKQATQVIEDRNGNLIIATWGEGIIIVGKNENELCFKKFPRTKLQNEANIFEALYIDIDDNLWLSNQVSLFKGDIITNNGKPEISLTPYRIENVGRTLEFNAGIHCIAGDGHKNIWIGTEYGIHILNRAGEKVASLFSEKGNDKSINVNLVNCLYPDGENMWIGTYQGGVNLYSPAYYRFSKTFGFINSSTDPLTRYVKFVLHDSLKQTWIGTDNGIVVYDKNLNLIHKFFHSSNPGSLQAGGVTSIFIDQNKQIWVGTWGGGLSMLNSKTGKFTKYTKYYGMNLTDTQCSGDASVFGMVEDSKGNLWIGYMFGILDCLDKKSLQFTHYDISNSINKPNLVMRSMVIDKHDNLWIGASAAGLIKFETKNRHVNLVNEQIFNAQNSLKLIGSEVYSLRLDYNDNLWLGTGNGLGYLKIATGKYELFGTERGLVSQTVNSVVPDDDNHVWVSTPKGISRYDKQNNFFVNYDINDGALLNAETSCLGKDGQVFFGGIDGILMFYPDSVYQNLMTPPVAFSDFKLFNQSVIVGSKELPLPVNEINEITLHHRQNVFSIDIAALNFVQPRKNQYMCKLEGFDNEWVMTGPNHEARYTNLNPGTYFFKVKAANNDGVWNSNERVLKIIIRPPWWSTWYFKLFILVLTIGFVIFYVSWRTTALKRMNIKLERKVQERTDEIIRHQEILKKQANDLQQINSTLLENQNEINTQKEIIENKNKKLEVKNKLLEEQNTQIRNQKLQVEEMSEKLHQADQLKLRFFSNVSHEFRTPLSLINGPVENILRELGPDDSPQLWQKVKLIHRNSQRLLRLINQFLDLSKIEAGMLKLSVSSGDVNSFIESIVDSYKFLAEQKVVNLKFTSEPGNYTCLFDADKLEKIIYNLLSNAFKHVVANGSITIRLGMGNFTNGVLQGEKALTISVSDTGSGIPKNVMGKIFERFYQIEDKGGTSSGTGIGLALTSELIEIYRGSIQVESEVGLGTTFLIMLPYEESVFLQSEISDSEVPVSDFNSEDVLSGKFEFEEIKIQNGNKKGISEKPSLLIVEDNLDTVIYLNDQLKSNFTIEFCYDGEQGWEKAVNLMPKAIVSDIMMPKMNGLQLCQKLKSDDRTCHIPVILLTAKANMLDLREGLEFGADDYITKPFDVEVLKLRLNNIIQNRERIKKIDWHKAILDPSIISVESADEKLLQKVMKTIDKKLSDPDFSVDELSRIAGLSRTHLYRKILDITSQTPIELIRNTRLKRAGQLLKQNKMYVSEIMYLSGFKEISYFRKIFKEYYGVSPAEYSGQSSEANNDTTV